MLFVKNVLADLAANPHGEPLTIPEAATALDTSPARVNSLVRDGQLGGTMDAGRVTAVSRASVRRALGLA